MANLITTVSQLSGTHYTGAGTVYLVEAHNGTLYQVFVDAFSDVSFRKSADGGRTWGAKVAVFVGTCAALAIWFDRWSGISAGLIHCAYSDSGSGDTLYRSIDTENSDALGTETTIFAGTDTASGGMLSITRARGGNLGCRSVIDAGAEGGFFRSTDVGATWGSRTDIEALATTDQCILLPGFAADNQDIIGIFWDASANEISRVLYDDSANSWSETSIVSATDSTAANGFPHFAAAVDLTNSQIVLIAWNAIDGANADLLCYTITESAITAKTPVVSNGTDDQGLCAVGIDLTTGYWHAYYAGESGGSETWPTALNIYYKISNDSGSTWGAETLESVGAAYQVRSLSTCPRFSGKTGVMYASFELGVNAPFLQYATRAAIPRAQSMLGI
jgi:hypothetical protein